MGVLGISSSLATRLEIYILRAICQSPADVVVVFRCKKGWPALPKSIAMEGLRYETWR